MTARLARITIYPVKSLDGVAVDEARLLPSGALEHDRRFSLFDVEGQIVNAKRFPQIQRVRSTFEIQKGTLTTWTEDSPERAAFALNSVSSRREFAAWISQIIDASAELREDDAVGFPDDLDSPGPTVVSTATLAAVAEWFPGLDVNEVRRRFRANLEIDGVEAFWEDRLVGKAGEVVPFSIGECQFLGVNPCQRCAVPTRSSLTAEVWPAFAKQFALRREQTLPAWAERSRFEHFYRLSVNTRLADGRIVRVGNEVTIA